MKKQKVMFVKNTILYMMRDASFFGWGKKNQQKKEEKR